MDSNNLSFSDNSRDSQATQYPNDAEGLQYLNTFVKVEPREDIPAKERDVQFHLAVVPFPCLFEGWEIDLAAFGFQISSDDGCVPWID